MTIIRIMTAMVIWLSLGLSASEAAECRVGSQQTLTGTMSEAIDAGDGQWLARSVEGAQPCTVTMLMGKGKVPAGCGHGEYFGRKKFTATGTVQDGIGVVLLVSSIRCSG